MPRFPIWVLGPETRRLILDVMNAYDVDTAIAEQETVRLERERGDQTRVERSRWLEEQHAERSFPCGLVPDQREVESGLPRLNVLPGEMTTMQVIAAVLPDDVVFIRDGSDDVVEVGRIPRTAIGDTTSWTGRAPTSPSRSTRRSRNRSCHCSSSDGRMRAWTMRTGSRSGHPGSRGAPAGS